jgi:Tol biopolymer transport system component
VDMISAGPACAEVTFPAQTVTWVNIDPFDASGTNGYREVEIYADTGEQYTNNTCVNLRSLTPVSGSVIPPVDIVTPTPAATSVPPTATSTPVPQGAGKIYYSSSRNNVQSIYSVNPDGTGTTLLSGSGTVYANNPKVSPDGSTIAYVRYHEGDPLRLWTMNSDGTGAVPITSFGVHGAGVTWSPDSTTLLFVKSDHTKVYTMHKDGTNLTEITGWPEKLGPTSWSPDGTTILGHKYTNGIWSLWTINSDGTNPVQISSESYSEQHGKYSSDGERILYISSANGNAEIWSMNADTTGKQRLTITPDSGSTEGSHSIFPQWSPDNSQIVFSSNRDHATGYWDVFVMNSDGSNVTNITNHPSAEQWSSWGP